MPPRFPSVPNLPCTVQHINVPVAHTQSHTHTHLQEPVDLCRCLLHALLAGEPGCQVAIFSLGLPQLLLHGRESLQQGCRASQVGQQAAASKPKQQRARGSSNWGLWWPQDTPARPLMSIQHKSTTAWALTCLRCVPALQLQWGLVRPWHSAAPVSTGPWPAHIINSPTGSWRAASKLLSF